MRGSGERGQIVCLYTCLPKSQINKRLTPNSMLAIPPTHDHLIPDVDPRRTNRKPIPPKDRRPSIPRIYPAPAHHLLKQAPAVAGAHSALVEIDVDAGAARAVGHEHDAASRPGERYLGPEVFVPGGREAVDHDVRTELFDLGFRSVA